MMKHKKHTNLKRRKNGNFAPNEVAILGTKCDTIEDLVREVSKKLTSFKLAYFDASHVKVIETPKKDKNILSEFVFHHQGNLQITTSGKINKFKQRIQFSEFDCVFINGNHYPGAKQVLILDPEKEASVFKRLNQLENILFVIKLTEKVGFFSFLDEKYPQLKKLPCYTINQVDEIALHFHKLIQKDIAPIKGLILTGGKSIRMGTDKSELNYYGKAQKDHLKKLLENNALVSFFSVQKPSRNLEEIVDTFLNLGPFGGICTAFQKEPNIAWLVLATDLPFVNQSIIELLLKNRNPSKIATAVKGKNKEFPEPLIAIYEPKAYGVLLQYLAQGYSCPRKVLINSDVEIIEVDDDLIRNINTKEEFELAKKEINKT